MTHRIETVTKPTILMVLNDGETYTNLDGCQIVEVPKTADLDDPDTIRNARVLKRFHVNDQIVDESEKRESKVDA